MTEAVGNLFSGWAAQSTFWLQCCGGSSPGGFVLDFSLSRKQRDSYRDVGHWVGHRSDTHS